MGHASDSIYADIAAAPTILAALARSQVAVILFLGKQPGAQFDKLVV